MLAALWRGLLSRVRNTIFLIWISIEKRLVWNWQIVFKRAWSMRLAAVAASLSLLEAYFVFGGRPSFLPEGTLPILAAVVSAGAYIARLVAQKGVHDGD
ncbi:hypothetical protein [Oryzifoliimicrobium ureilyticus]|uniref:DUF7940 domain-containing protein n=1 Tax=Oryzifoliimicrobium ureilyticus TaxID=3113724 RepID=UPI0030766069